MPEHNGAPPAGTRRGAKDEHIGGALAGHYSSAPVHALLDRLDGTRETGAGRWIARCPAHEDRSPSLGIRELGDGTVLIRCHAGCGAADVVAAVGLELRDLFPAREDHRQRSVRPRDRFVPRDVLRCLADEAMLLLIAAEDTAAGKPLSGADRDRLAQAVHRIRAGAREAGCRV